jgi:glycerol-3-phosphate dehydrogenase
MSANPPATQAYCRQQQLEQLAAGEPLDVLVIGGGATGVGIAVDAAVRGYRVALCEQSDFGQGTSSRSTKLVHGGVRYLEQGNVRLVREALHERGLLLANAPHLVYKLPTVVPLYRWWEPFYYRTGLAVYDALAGRLAFGRSRRLSRKATIEAVPTIRGNGLKGGVSYFDGGFDDARLLVNLVQTAIDHGATCVNYAQISQLLLHAGKVLGAEVLDRESGATHTITAKVVVNAAGPFSDGVRQLADASAERLIQPSQGAHVVLDRHFLPSDSALIVPKTSDGRVVFAIPWHGKTLVGTTDTALAETPLEPRPLRQEVDFLLETLGGVLSVAVDESDIRSVFAGLRPLVRRGKLSTTSKLGRDHVVHIDTNGLVTMLGGKWTTYRKMAQDCVDRCAELADLPRVECRTRDLPIHRGELHDSQLQASRLASYGSEAAKVGELIASDAALATPLDLSLPYTVGEAVWAIRHEMARTVEDVLSRRLRMLLLDAAAAERAAPRVAKLLAQELEHDAAWEAAQIEAFTQLAAGYRVAGCVTQSPASTTL